MNGYGYGYPGQREAADPWNRSNNTSAVSKMEHTFWVTKQSVYRKLGKKEDECIIASDAELDAKLELFRSVQETCSDLQRILDKYQERLCNLAQEESSMGRFLKECSKRDQTNAGKAMVIVGKALSYSGQQRLALRVPLQRLYQEVETFRQRAIEDTLLNVSAMEKQRTEYRAALSWMKNISQELDPDTHKQLEKFRKVQGQVRQSKANFDRLKLDCLQKVDLLAAARCNMFSHALTLYQQALIQHARRAHRAFGSVAKDVKGYQHYEFSVVPELTEESSRLAKQTKDMDNKAEEEGEAMKEELLFFDTEYHDKVDDMEGTAARHKSDSLQNLLSSSSAQATFPLIPLETEAGDDILNFGGKEISEVDLLASDCLSQLDDILSKSSSTETPAGLSVSEEWASLFESGINDHVGEISSLPSSEGYLPSHLLENFTSSINIQSSSLVESKKGVVDLSAKDTLSQVTSPNEQGFVSNLMANLRHHAAPDRVMSPQTSGTQIQSKTGNLNKKDMSAWYDLFADLDPLSNPDALDSKVQEEERNC